MRGSALALRGRVLALVVVAICVGCGGGVPDDPVASGGVTTGPIASSTPAADGDTVALWFVRDGKPERVVTSGTATEVTLRRALELLLAGPDVGQRADGLITAIPSGAALRDVSLENGVATIDLARTLDGVDVRLALCQLVRTATEFDTVRWVRIHVDGADGTFTDTAGTVFSGLLDRRTIDGGADHEPWIELTSPVDGDTVNGKVAFVGTADVYEGALSVRLIAGDATIATSTVQASCGTGCRGAFAGEIAIPAGTSGPVRLELFSLSAEDGSELDLVGRSIAIG